MLFHQVPCETEKDKANYSLIGNGLIINASDLSRWEESIYMDW